MEDMMSFLWGIIAFIVLALLLIFEISLGNTLFVNLIYVLIAIVLATMVVKLRGSFLHFLRLLAGRAHIKRPEKPQGEPIGRRKIDAFLSSHPEEKETLKKPVSHPKLKELMKGLESRKPKPAPEKPRGPSRLSGLGKRLRGIRLPKLSKPKMPEMHMPEVHVPEMPELPKLKSARKSRPAKAKPVERLKPLFKRKPRAPKPRRPVEKPKPLPRPEPMPEPITEPAPEKPANGCQICGKAGAGPYTIEAGSTILLCSHHRSQAEQGFYSKQLLKKLKG